MRYLQTRRTVRRIHLDASLRPSRPVTCPPWCVTDHSAVAEQEARTGWREHRSAAAVLETYLGDRVSVDLLAGDDLQTGGRGDAGVRVRVTADLLSPDEARHVAAVLTSTASITDGPSCRGGGA